MGEVVAFRPSSLPPQLAASRSLQEVVAWFQANAHHLHKAATRAHYGRAFALALQGSTGIRGKGPVRALSAFPMERDVTEWFSRMRTAGYGERTVALMRSDLCRAYSYASIHGFSSGNPVIDARWKPARATRKALLDVASTWEFVRAAFAGRPREFAFLCMLRHTAGRKGEVLGTEARHIDWTISAALPAGQVQIDQQRVKANERKATRDLKSDAAHRWIAMHPELREALRVLIQQEGTHHEIRSGYGGGLREVTPFLFPYGESQLGEILKVLRGIDPEGFPPGDAWHVFRHTKAVELNRQNEPIREIQRFLGHVSLEHTCQYLRALDGSTAVAPAAFAADCEAIGVKKAPVAPAMVKHLPPPLPRRSKKERPAQIAPGQAAQPRAGVTLAAPEIEVAPSTAVAVPPVAPLEESPE